MADGMLTGPIGHSPDGSPAYTYGGGIDRGQMRIVDFNTNAIQNYYKGLSGFWGDTTKAFGSMMSTYHKWEAWKFKEEQDILKFTMGLMNTHPEMAKELFTETEMKQIYKRIKESSL
tara:strand:- start:23 stop:373 length:351 start_codon:yes stop_codon:yes gene_type:complete